jgi:signal transduction histidine kinase
MMTSSALRRPSQDIAGRWIRAAGRLAVWAIVAAVGLISFSVAWRAAGFSFESVSPLAALLGLAAGWGLAASGLESRRRGRRRTFGALLAAAGVAWFVADWAVPSIGSSIAFTLGLALGWIYPALVVHALFVFTPGHIAGRADRFLIGAGYAIFAVVLGLVPALAFEPGAMNCGFCPTNHLGVLPSAELLAGATRLGSVLATAWCALVSLTLSVRLARQSPASRRIHAPVVVPGIAFTVLVGVEFGRGFGQVVSPIDDISHLARLGQAAMLLAVAAGVAFEWIQARRSRTRVTRVVADLGRSPAPGRLRDALAATLHDPRLALGYPSADGSYVDARGQPFSLSPAPDRRSTPIIREGQVVAVIEHRKDVLEDQSQIDEVVAAARLGLEHERLQAQARAQLEELRAARRRIVAAADAARRGLERDLHDGAQQRLIALSIGLRLLARSAAGGLSASEDALIEEAAGELRLALEDLREVAHGIYPAVLTDEGLAAAIDGLAERASVQLTILGIPDERFEPILEATAYQLVAETVRASNGPVRVRAQRVGDQLVIEVTSARPPDEVLEELGDRVGALDGSLAVRQGEGQMLVLRAEIPCAS